MKALLKLLLIAAVVLPFSGMDAGAQSTKQDIEALKKQIDAIQRQSQQQIEQLQRKVEMLETAREADKERIVEIEEENRDAWYQKFMAKYDKGLTFQSDNGNFKMRFRIRGQFRLTVEDEDDRDPETSTNFEVRRLRFIWDGHAFKPWFLYYVQFGVEGSASLRDMYFTVAYDNNIAPRVGQFKVPFGRDELNSSSALQFVDRSIINDEFGLGRDRGAVLLGGFGPQYNFSYSGGVFNGDGRNGFSNDSNLLYAGRLQFGWGGEGKKFKANSSYATGEAYEIVPNFAKSPTITIGGGAAVLPGLNCDRKSPDNDTCDRMAELGLIRADYITATGDINFKMPVFNVQGSYYGRWIDPDQTGIAQDTAYDQGFNAQAGVFVLPRTVEIAGRFSWIDYDTSSGVLPPDVGSVRDTKWAVTPGLNYYISHDHRWKIQLDYSFIRNEFTEGAPDVDENQFRAQLQAYF
ncbi:MAG: porin [Deltaproteobacteria bacterium]